MSDVVVSGLWRYPVKSLGGVAEDEMAIDATGPLGDRRWALVDPDGSRVAARTVPTLLGLTAEPTATGIVLSDRDGDRLAVSEPGEEAPVVATSISRRPTLTVADNAASAWISDRIGQPLTLVFQRSDQPRTVSAEHGGLPGDLMGLADAGPLLLVTEESVRQVADWVDDESPDWRDVRTAARRFRPNLLVRGAPAFSEDHWARIRVGDTWLRRSEDCDRCVMTSIDHTSLRTTKEPIRALARHRRRDGTTWFGVRYVPEVPTGVVRRLRVGDTVTVEPAG